jgi:uncharacterized membrane protein YoaK (UPF0700 family)
MSMYQKASRGVMAAQQVATEVHGEAIGPNARDLLLSALTVSSGAVDAISFLALGKVFSAFMTGNVAFLGLRIAGAPAPGLGSILSSMVAFAVGVYLSTRIVKPAEVSCTWPRRVTIALGVSLIPHAAFVAVWLANHGQPTIAVANLLLGLWGLAMGMQSAAVRRLHVDGVFTTAATATIIVLLSDVANWSGTAEERRRLGSVLASLLVGATAGGVLLVHAHNVAPVLPFAITLGVVATAATVSRQQRQARYSSSAQ